MEKAITYYVEKVYNISTNNGSKEKYEIQKVDTKNPLMIEEEKDLIGFRFYDVDEKGNKTDYSGMYYFGERITIKELILIDNDFIKQMQRDYLVRRGIEEAIFCENANRIICCIDSNDRTIDEVKLERIKEQARAIFINQREFLNRIIDLLEKYGNDVDIVMLERYYPIADVITEDDVDDVSSIIRTYDLYVNEYKVLSSSAIVNKNNMGLDNINTYIRLSDALETFESLYQEYPYLEVVINNFMLELSNNNVRNISITKNKTKHK